MTATGLLAIYSTKDLFFLDKSQIFLFLQRYFPAVHLRRVITCVAPRPGPLSELSRGSAPPIIFFTHPPSRYNVSPPLPSLQHTSLHPLRKCASLSQPSPAQPSPAQPSPAQPSPGCTVRELLSGSSPLTYILHTRHTAPCTL